MSCGCDVEQEKDSNPSLLEKESNYAKAIQAILDAKPEDITDQITYMDKNCHGCLVGHVLKVTDGLNYQLYNEDQEERLRNTNSTADGIVRKLMDKNFGEQSIRLDSDLSAIHNDYLEDNISFEEMKAYAKDCLESYRDGKHWIYELEGDFDDYDDEDE